MMNDPNITSIHFFLSMLLLPGKKSTPTAIMMKKCPAPHILQCRCTISAMLHSAYMSFYPRSGLLAYGQLMLFNVRHLDGLGLHFWETVIRNAYKVSEEDVKYLRGCITLYPPPSPDKKKKKAVLSNIESVRRIQRGVRCFLRRRRLLALMMGAHHPRLGSGSCLAEMPVDLVGLIFDQTI